MAWVAEENFNSYADESNLATQNGGSGWGAAWVNSATNVISADTAQSYEGGVSARTVSGGGNTFYTRTLSSSVSGDGNVVYLAMRMSVNNSGTNDFSVRSSTGRRAGVTMNASGNIVLTGTTNVTLVSGFTANQWYAIRLTFNVTANTATAATSTGSYQGGGSWSSESSAVTMSNSGNIDRVGIGGDTGSGLSFLDIISATDILAAANLANLKTYNGIAKANIKTINGVAIANVKTLNGIT